MPDLTDEELENVRDVLHQKINEWIGSDYPEEGDEDYDTLMWMRQEADSLRDIWDALELPVVGDAVEFLALCDINPIGLIDFEDVYLSSLYNLDPRLLAANGSNEHAAKLYGVGAHYVLVDQDEKIVDCFTAAVDEDSVD